MSNPFNKYLIYLIHCGLMTPHGDKIVSGNDLLLDGPIPLPDWLLANKALRNDLRRFFHRYTIISIDENEFEYVVYKIWIILLMPQCVKQRTVAPLDSRHSTPFYLLPWQSRLRSDILAAEKRPLTFNVWLASMCALSGVNDWCTRVFSDTHSCRPSINEAV